jgi:hypothetical protein
MFKTSRAISGILGEELQKEETPETGDHVLCG